MCGGRSRLAGRACLKWSQMCGQRREQASFPYEDNTLFCVSAGA